MRTLAEREEDEKKAKSVIDRHFFIRTLVYSNVLVLLTYPKALGLYIG